MSTTERRKQQGKKSSSSEDERFRQVVESAPNAMVLINEAGNIVLVNSQAERVFGYSRKEIVGKPVETLIPERFKKNHPVFRSNYLQSAATRPMGAGRDLFALRKNGTEFPVEIGLNPMESDDGQMVLASIIDITERRKTEEHFRLVVESAPYAMILVDQHGKITLVNNETEKLFRYNRNQLIGVDVETLLPIRFRNQHISFRNHFHSKPQTRRMGIGRDLFAMRRDGTEFPVEIGLNPIESSEGHMVLASITDISERKAQEANKLKSEFLANMSHELRTPLNAVLGFSELLIDKKVGELNSKQVEYLHDIHASGSHLLQLINNVLDLSKIEAGKVELRIEEFDLAEAVEGVVNALVPLADKKGISITTQLTPDVVVVRLDKNKFRQILFNLISNAIKFNQKGGSILIESLKPGVNTFIFKITDTGIGISAEDQKKIFIPFVQIDPSMSRRHEGTGLGLALTKDIIELHLGKIEVKSELNVGTSFSVTLPIFLQERTD